MAGIPSELLAQIANPQGPQNVLEMFSRGQQQGQQNQQMAWQGQSRNALIAAAEAANRQDWPTANAEAAKTGDPQVMSGYISMYEQQRKRKQEEEQRALLQKWLQPGAQRPSKAQASLMMGDEKGAIDAMYAGGGRPATSEEKAAFSLPADAPLWFDGDNQPHMLSGGTNITIDNKGISKEEEVAGGKRGERVDALESGASIKNLQQLRFIGKQMEGLNTGPLSKAQMTAGAFMSQLGASPETLKDFGIDPNLVTTGPQLQALINRQVVGMIGSGQFPAQNFSDTDRIFLEKIFPSLSNVPGANQLITATTERMIQIEEAKLQAWYAASDQGVTFRDFERQWNRRLSQMDVFGDIAEQAQSLGGSSEQPKRRIYNPNTGKLE
jgi:hypothetical protein